MTETVWLLVLLFLLLYLIVSFTLLCIQLKQLQAHLQHFIGKLNRLGQK